jgi:hypothetical protein
MNIKLILAAAFITVIFVSGAHAVTISNNDGKEYKLTVFEGAATKELMIKPGETIENICGKTCSVRLNDSEDDEYEFDATDILAIEDGQMSFQEDANEQGSTSEDDDGKNSESLSDEK